MAINLKTWALSSLLILSTPVLAGTQTADFSNYANNNSQRNTIVDSTGTVSATAWSDTLNGSSADHTIEQARYMQRYGSGWGITNQDENGSSPGHSADNLGSNMNWRDYDFFLMDFTHDVQLTKATFSWIYSSKANTQISYVALDANKINGLGGNISGLSWAQIRDSYSLGHGYSTVSNSSGYHIDVNVNQKTRYWLVGAFNSVFGGSSGLEGNDGFKLKSVAFNKKSGTSVPEPGSLALIGLAMLMLVGKRKKQV